MSIKTILAPVNGTDADGPRLKLAFAAARRLDAHVDVMFTRLDPADAVPVVGEGMSSAVIDQLITAAEQEARRCRDVARRHFEVAVSALGVPVHDTPPGPGSATAAWEERVGREERLVRKRCALADLVVLSHEPGDEENLQLTLTFEATLMHGGRPLLLAPAATPRDVGAVAAIAWDGGPQCARAVTSALPFLHLAEVTHVLTAMSAHQDPAMAGALVDYLAWHGIESQAHRIEPGNGSVGEALLETASAFGTDLLVMGGYSHSRMREMILGGVTRYVLANAGLPVLMAH